MTSQLPETLMIDGESLDLFTTPLASWLAQQGLRIGSGRVASICARGYRGLWQIKACRLRLRDVAAFGAESRLSLPSGPRSEVSLRAIFPATSGPVPADWFTGTLRCPLGRRLTRHRDEFGAPFARDLMIDIEAGQVTRTWVRSNVVHS
jgi:hypothetical protein